MGEVDALISLKSLVLIEVIGYMLFFLLNTCLSVYILLPLHIYFLFSPI